jgi:hypothetical protein
METCSRYEHAHSMVRVQDQGWGWEEKDCALGGVDEVSGVG